MTVAAPEADLGILPKADGSATFKYAGYTITASVNGPIEAARRDEHPYKAHVDVIVRPAAGTGGKPFQHHTTRLYVERSIIGLITYIYRHERTSSRVTVGIVTLTDHFGQGLPTVSDSDCPAG